MTRFSCLGTANQTDIEAGGGSFSILIGPGGLRGNCSLCLASSFGSFASCVSAARKFVLGWSARRCL